MTAQLQRLIESLRNELQQYGEMLALLDQQRQAVLHQGADDVMHCLSAIHAQGGVIKKARQIREAALAKLARSLGEAPAATFSNLIPLMPETFRPLVTALVQENNDLVLAVRQRAEQNHGLLQRSLDLMGKFIVNLHAEEARDVTVEVLPTKAADQSSDTVYEALA